jgi:hypothetical protein
MDGFRLGGKTAARQDDFAIGCLQMKTDLAVFASKDFELWFTHTTRI